MSLTRVTITGADDATDPDDLQKLSEEFPFVEWAILVGSSTGPRFPTAEWINRLVDVRTETGNIMYLSLHVCGKFLREIANGHSSLRNYLEWRLFAFERVQLNWHGEKQSSSVSQNVLNAFCSLDVGGWDPQLIFQLDGVNDQLYLEASRRFACTGLFDRSHGAGLLPGEWPQAHKEIGCGWAGGLGPENLGEEIPKISTKACKVMDFWIDMETRVRSDDDMTLDLSRVKRCLEIAKPFIGV